MGCTIQKQSRNTFYNGYTPEQYAKEFGYQLDENLQGSNNGIKPILSNSLVRRQTTNSTITSSQGNNWSPLSIKSTMAEQLQRLKKKSVRFYMDSCQENEIDEQEEYTNEEFNEFEGSHFPINFSDKQSSRVSENKQKNSIENLNQKPKSQSQISDN